MKDIGKNLLKELPKFDLEKVKNFHLENLSKTC